MTKLFIVDIQINAFKTYPSGKVLFTGLSQDTIGAGIMKWAANHSYKR
jgi:hypothetical protein